MANGRAMSNAERARAAMIMGEGGRKMSNAERARAAMIMDAW